MLWVDKYRPRTLDKVMVHKEEATNLKNLVSVASLVGNWLRGRVWGGFVVTMCSVVGFGCWGFR